MQKPTDPNFYDIEKEYMKMTKGLYKDLTKYIVLGVLIVIIYNFLDAFVNRQIYLSFTLAGVIFLSTLGLKMIWRNHEGHEMGITVFYFLFYLSGLVINFMDKKYLKNPVDTFLFSYGYCMLERLIVQGMSNLKHRIAFTFLAMLMRFLIMPTFENESYAMQVLFVSLIIYLDVFREKRHKNLFCAYLNSKEQLIKFKNLIAFDIPDPIAIISQDLQKLPFINNSFMDLVAYNGEPDIQHQLDQFILQEEIGPSSYPDLDKIRGKSSQKPTLLAFLKNSFEGEQKHLKEYSLIVSRKKHIRQASSPYLESEPKILLGVKIFNIIWDDEPSIALILHDITQEHTILTLKIADAQKDRILASVSHELKTPLNAMLGMIQIMEKRIKDSEILRFLTICKNSTNLLVSLVKSILDLNQIRTNKIKLNLEEVDLFELLQKIICLFEYQCQQKGIYLNLKISNCVQRFLTTDRDRLSQILINLVGNAVKFTSKGGICLSVEPEKNGESIQFKVQDTGIGIPRQDMDKLFKVFGRIDQEDKKTMSQGVGLGLTIAENLVKILNDNRNSRGISLESEYGKGSTFSFSIKSRMHLATDEDQDCNVAINTQENITEKIESHIFQKHNSLQSFSLSNFTPSGQRKTTSFQVSKVFRSQPDLSRSRFEFNTSPNHKDSILLTPSILLVDDDLFNIAVAKYLLLSNGHNVKTALSGQSALDLISNNDHQMDPIILILMDCQMPIMDGYETSNILNKMMEENKIPKIPIVALTANDSDADKETCKKSGMCDYLSKPLTNSDLERILQKYCKNSVK